MTSMAITTVVKMLETLPEAEQELVVKQVRELITEMQDEATWNALLKKTQSKLIAAARAAKQEIKAGRSEPLDEKRL